MAQNHLREKEPTLDLVKLEASRFETRPSASSFFTIFFLTELHQFKSSTIFHWRNYALHRESTFNYYLSSTQSLNSICTDDWFTTQFVVQVERDPSWSDARYIALFSLLSSIWWKIFNCNIHIIYVYKFVLTLQSSRRNDSKNSRPKSGKKISRRSARCTFQWITTWAESRWQPRYLLSVIITRGGGTILRLCTISRWNVRNANERISRRHQAN